MSTQLAQSPRRPRPPSLAPQPTTYVLVPLRLIEDLRDSPLAIGVYALIGRLHLISGEPVPLSPVDLQAYDPAVSYGAARRACERLVAAGYALASGVAGHKMTYRPTWGGVHGAVVAWDRGAGELGRPGHIRTVRVDDRLLDLCLGRLRPHRSHRAVVTRYLPAPALGLRDVGAYALARASITTASPALTSLGLLNAAGSPLLLPADHILLERAAGCGEESALSPADMYHTGNTSPTPILLGDALATPAPSGVTGGGDGYQIGGVIGSGDDDQEPNTASERPAPPLARAEPRSHGWTESHGVNGSPTTPPVPAPEAAPGGGVMKIQHPSHAHEQSTPTPTLTATATQTPPSTRSSGPLMADLSQTPAETATSGLLRSLGVRADVARTLADRDPTQVERVIAQVRARRDVRDVAAWVVSALRALPAAEATPPPKVSEKAILFHPRLSGYDRQRWLARFRGADPADRPAILARFTTEHPLEDHDVPAA